MVLFPIKGPKGSSSELSVTPECAYHMLDPVLAALSCCGAQRAHSYSFMLYEQNSNRGKESDKCLGETREKLR